MGLTNEDLKILGKIVQEGLGNPATCLFFALLGGFTCGIVTILAEC